MEPKTPPTTKDFYYITTTLPYVNADPHIGFAMETTRADVLARYHRLLGEEVFFNTGTDEHGLKIYEEARQAGLDPQEFADKCAKQFEALKEAFNLSYNNFIRTTDPHHVEASREFWRQSLKNGDIYKSKQKINYCVGCEMEKTESELVDGRCPLHPNRELDILEEENYFFRFSNYQQPLIKLYKSCPEFVVPAFRQNEIQSFVEKGLRDFSISRLKKKLPWGVDVPDDPEHVMYVWFDALINYISTIGWPDDKESFEKWWPAVQIAGKDNLRQQAAMWQAMLFSVGLPASKQVYVEGFINAAGGQKMSKSLGNVIDPFKVVKKYGTDAVRYYLLREIPSYDDGDFSEGRFVELYNADLANGLGNLVARVAKLMEKSGITYRFRQDLSKRRPGTEVAEALDRFRFDEALGIIWNRIAACDKAIDRQKPWQLEGRELSAVLLPLVLEIKSIASNLLPFLPETAEKIHAQFDESPIKSAPPLFPRLEKVSLIAPTSRKNQTKLIVVGKIIELASHPNTDSLKIAKVDIGQKTLAIVCGAKNLSIGQTVPVALPGAIVKQPSGKTLKVKAVAIRGEKSEGMLLSGLELGVNQNHKEIYILPEDFKTGETITPKKLKVLK